MKRLSITLLLSIAMFTNAMAQNNSYDRPQEAAIEADVNKPYNSEDVTFTNGAVTLAGTLTIPKTISNFPAVVLVVGSGPHDRDETIFEHKPFLLLADALSRQGFVVLRYDKRGVGSSTPGTPDDTSVQLAEDAMAALRYLQTRPEVDARHIGIVGHSEGGSIAMMNASAHPDEVAFIVSMAGPAIKGVDLMVEQNRLILLSQGIEANDLMLQPVRNLYEFVLAEEDTEALRTQLSEMMLSENDVNILCSPAYRHLLQYDPTEDLKRVHCPMLAINGVHDIQVSCKTNLDAITRLVPHATVKAYENLNHLFQTTDGWQGIDSYASTSETLAPQVINDIVTWLQSTVKQ